MLQLAYNGVPASCWSTKSRSKLNTIYRALDKQAFQLLSPDRRRKTFFVYEKRVRELSAPDKTFDYFASVQGPGGRR